MTIPQKLARLMMYDKEDRPWAGMRLFSSAIIGHTTPTTAKIWVRVHKAGTYVLFLSETSVDTSRQPRLADGETVKLHGVEEGEKETSLGDIIVSKANITLETDLTHVFNIKGLNPGTTYNYAVFAHEDADGNRRENWEIGRDAPLSFKTPPKNPDSVAFGLYSCHMPFNGRSVNNLHMWDHFYDTLKDYGADFVLGAGDQVYSDGDGRVSIWDYLKARKDEVAALTKDERIAVMTSWYRDIYRGYWGDIKLRRVMRSFPNYMVWDDHEIMDGWGSYSEKELSQHLDTIWEWEDKEKNLLLAFDMFEAAKKVYREYQHEHNPSTGNDQWDYTFDWGPFRYFVLDMRGHRDLEDQARYKILGYSQYLRFKRWMESRKSSRAAALFVVSPVPVVHLKDFVLNWLDLPALGLADDLRDEWEHEEHGRELNLLLELVFDYSHKTGKPVVFLSGDVHVGAAFKLSRRNQRNARVFQLTSSGITYCKSPGRLLKLIVKTNGEIENTREPKVTYQRLHVLAENNFGIVRGSKQQGKGLELYWDLYGNGSSEEEIVKLKRIPLVGSAGG